MITVTQQQFDRFWIADKEDFITRLQEEVIEDAPWVRTAWPPRLLHEAVAYSLDRALANGFTDDVDLRTFVSLMFVIGPDFDQNPEIHKVLSDTSLSTTERWDRLTQDPAYSQIWQELSESNHQTDWFPEEREKIEQAYPTTYALPGFVALYDKVRKERYHNLSPGE